MDICPVWRRNRQGRFLIAVVLEANRSPQDGQRSRVVWIQQLDLVVSFRERPHPHSTRRVRVPAFRRPRFTYPRSFPDRREPSCDEIHYDRTANQLIQTPTEA